MKPFIIAFLLLINAQAIHGQENSFSGEPPFDGPQFFFALIVSDIDSSIIWYEEVFEFKLINSQEVERIKLKQANLNRENIYLELIQLESAINPEEAISGFNQKSKLTGLFKIGFSVDEFDLFVSRMREMDVNIHGDVVLDPNTQKRMVIIKDPDGNRIQIFE